ncbi:MAG: PilZ domain-containing protein [Methylococcales bacterium]|nr:PilZ domain-containing protein [Methylococcales bacterium]
MNSESKRSYRKKLIAPALIYINGEERKVLVVNMSITGILVQLKYKDMYSEHSNDMSSDTLVSTVIDFYLPTLRLAGTAEIIRVEKEEIQVFLALKFKDIAYDADGVLYQRKAYRKNVSIQGQILLNNGYHNFNTINTSVDGLMIQLVETLAIAEGMITSFEFNNLSVKGEVEVVWIDFDVDGNTLMGLKYISLASAPSQLHSLTY